MLASVQCTNLSAVRSGDNMALKYELDSLDGLDESLASHYAQRADGKFALSFEGSDPVAGAVNAKNHEKQARQLAEQKINELTGQITTLTSDLSNAKFELDKAGGPAGKTEAYERKIEELKNTIQSTKDELEAAKVSGAKAMTDYVGAQYLDRIATDIGSSPKAVAAIKKLFNGSVIAEQSEDGYKQAFVIDGKPALITEQEFKDLIHNEYPELVSGSKASGSGAISAKPSGGAGDNNTGGSMVDRAKQIIKANS